MGKSISHRTQIIKEWLHGNEYSEISRKTNHSIDAVANYIDKFKRIVCLAKDNYEIKTIAFMVKLSPSLTQEYYSIYQSEKIVSHRKKELESLSKKND
jgi:hypothetical protein